jgi:prepilin-type N-terminal cleavage/methylation domain-containing protein
LKEKKLAFSLLEVMISSAIVSVCLLGIAAMQTKLMSITIEGSRQETATRMLRQWVNFANRSTKTDLLRFIEPTTSSVVNANCYNSGSGAGCSMAEWYEALFRNYWANTVQQIFPDGDICVCVQSITSNQPISTVLRFAIRWKSLSGKLRHVFIDQTFLHDITQAAGTASTFLQCFQNLESSCASTNFS